MIACQSPASPLWKDVLTVVPGVVTAATAIVGVLIARSGLNAWRAEMLGKRRIELAEEVLADFYRAKDVFDQVRSPVIWEGEGAKRRRSDWESDDDFEALNSYAAIADRFNENTDFFAQFLSRRYRFWAVFGGQAKEPFDEIFKIRGDILLAMRMLLMVQRQKGDETISDERRKWLATIGRGLPDEDPIPGRIAAATEAIERICRPAIEGGV